MNSSHETNPLAGSSIKEISTILNNHIANLLIYNNQLRIDLEPLKEELLCFPPDTALSEFRSGVFRLSEYSPDMPCKRLWLALQRPAVLPVQFPVVSAGVALTAILGVLSAFGSVCNQIDRHS